MAEYSSESSNRYSSSNRNENRGGHQGNRSYGSRNNSYGNRGGKGSRTDSKGYRKSDGRDGHFSSKRDGDDRKGSYGNRSGKPYRKYDDSERSGKPYRKYNDSDRSEKPYRKYNDSNRSGKPYRKYSDSDSPDKPYKKNYDNRSGKSYSDDDRNDRPYKKKYNDRNNGSYNRNSRSDKPYKKYDAESSNQNDGERRNSYSKDKPRTYGSRKPYNKGNRSARPYDKKPSAKKYDYKDKGEGFDDLNLDELELVDVNEASRAREGSFENSESPRSFGERREASRGRKGRKRVDTISRRDLVKIATTDDSADFVYAGSGLRHTGSVFYVDPGDPIVSEQYGEGLVSKVISGKVQVEFEDGKRWFAHPMAMEKGIILKPGMPKPEPAERMTEDDFEEEIDEATDNDMISNDVERLLSLSTLEGDQKAENDIDLFSADALLTGEDFDNPQGEIE